jgi:hypothetical protein
VVLRLLAWRAHLTTWKAHMELAKRTRAGQTWDKWTWIPALLAAVVLLIGVAATWVGPDSWWSERCPSAFGQERTSAEVRASLLPPGSKCVVTLLPSGREITRTYVPLREWLLVLLAAAFSWGVTRFALRRLQTRSTARGDSAGAT